MGNPPIVTAQKLSKSYGSHIAVDGMSFNIHRGETFGLLGPKSGRVYGSNLPAGAGQSRG